MTRWGGAAIFAAALAASLAARDAASRTPGGDGEPAGPAPPTCRTASAEVERVIAGKARSLRMAECCQFRRYDALDDVDGDGKEDFIVLSRSRDRTGGTIT